MCANQSIVANPNYNTWDSIRACTVHNILLTWTGGSFLDLTICNETQIIVSPTNLKKTKTKNNKPKAFMYDCFKYLMTIFVQCKVGCGRAKQF